jgi:hypothetical protein
MGQIHSSRVERSAKSLIAEQFAWLDADSHFERGGINKCRQRRKMGPMTASRLNFAHYHRCMVRDEILSRAEPVVDCFYEAVLACHREPPFKPSVAIATSPGPIRYDHHSRSVVLVPYELLDPAVRTGMERYAAIGTLGLSGRAQYEEIFQGLLIAHELGHWLQMIAHQPLTRWQAEYGANRIMVAFWREYPAATASTDARLANFVVQPRHFPSLIPEGLDMPPEIYFNQSYEEIDANPTRYAGFQKMMVRQAVAEEPQPRFCDLVSSTWPDSLS